MAKYYSVERSSNYLVHSGVRGMKWGIRKKRLMKGAKKWFRGFREDVRDGAKAAALSTIMGPGAAMYVQSRRAVADKPKKKRKY